MNVHVRLHLSLDMLILERTEAQDKRKELEVVRVSILLLKFL
jgi:hypothetical protein